MAGVHRVLAVAPEHRRAPTSVVVVAGMDGALPSVVAGLTDRLVVAVPTSVGYGAAFEGLAALLDDADRLRARRARSSTSTTGSARAWPPRGSQVGPQAAAQR